MSDKTIIELDALDSCIVFHNNGEITVNLPAQEDDEILLPSSIKIFEVLQALYGDIEDI